MSNGVITLSRLALAAVLTTSACTETTVPPEFEPGAARCGHGRAE